MSIDAFISYSHADEKAVDRLHKHLAMLQREGEIRAWSDHKLLPGAKLDPEISGALDKSGLFLALVSPDFLASNYCYEKEFQRALQLTEAGKMRIVPIILEPCDWRASPLSQFMALPKDGKPISEWTNQNNAFLDVVTGLRRVITAPTVVETQSSGEVPMRRPRVKQDFDAIQKSEFADRAYDIIQSYFENSCKELNEMGDSILKAKFEQMSQTAFTCTVVNRAKRSGGEAHITVRNSKQASHFGDISYVYARHASDNTSNGSIRVEADDYSLFLTLDSFSGGRRGDTKSTPQQAASALWVDFVKHAGVEYE